MSETLLISIFLYIMIVFSRILGFTIMNKISDETDKIPIKKIITYSIFWPFYLLKKIFETICDIIRIINDR